MDILVYNVFLPEVVDKDIVSQEVKVVVDGVEQVSTYDVSTKVFEIQVQEQKNVAISVRHVDDAGNKNDWSNELTFTAIDTIISPVEGAPSVKLIAEIHVEDVPVEPEVPTEPEVPVEPEVPTEPEV